MLDSYKSGTGVAALLLSWLVAASARGEDVRFVVNDAQRPLAAALASLEAREGWTITYEEPLVGSAPSGSVELAYAISDETRGDSELQAKALGHLIEQQNAKKPTFRLVSSGAYWHVIPVNGTPLDNVITLPRQVRPLGEVLQDICAAVGKLSGVRVNLGSTAGLPLDMLVVQEATQETARNVLVRVLAGSSRRTVWTLLRDDDRSGYTLTLHRVFRVAGR